MLTMMSNVAVVTMLPHLSMIFKEIPNIELLSRLMITLPSLAIALFAPFLGHFVNRFGKKRSAIIALFAFSLFGTAGLYLETIYMILASRFLMGIAIAVMMIVSTSLIGDYFQGAERHKFMGLQSAFMSIGGIIFIIGGGYLSDIGWRYPFAIYFIGIVIAIFVIKYLIEHQAHLHKVDEEAHLLKHNMWYIYVLAFTLMVVFYILPTQMPFLIINVFHASGTLTGGIIAMAFIFNAAGALSFAKLKKRFAFRSIYMIGFLIIGTGFIIVGNIDNLVIFFLTSPILGFGGGLMMANMTAWMLSVAHHSKRVKSSSYLTSALFLGQFFSPIVTHPLVAHFGVQNFFIVSGGILFVSIAVSFGLLKLKRLYKHL